MTQSAISLRNVSKSYGEFTLGPVDLEVEVGYVVAVVGPNGSGKSTLFRILMSLAQPDGGDLSIFGMRYPDGEVDMKRRIGYVPERAVGHDDMSARELGEFVAHWYPTWDREAYGSFLDTSGIDRDKKFGDLSKGQQRRISFAVAASTGADLLLLDEPTDGVDPFARREMLQDISGFMDTGEKTVVMATHVMEEVRRIADYVVFLVDGEFLGIFEKDDLTESWRTLWVEAGGQDVSAMPGVVETEEGSPTRLVTDSPQRTEDALSEKGLRVVRSGPLDLEEILGHLMRRSKTGEKERSGA